MKFNCIIGLFLSFSIVNSVAQGNDTLEVVNHSYDSILSTDAFFLDVLFYKQKSDVLINNLGPFGSTNYYPTTFGLNGINRFYLNEKSKGVISKLEGVKPFTNISYINASRKEQVISVNHFQKLGKLVTFSFDYTRLSSPGSYINQEVNNTLFDVLFSYKSIKNIYCLTFSSFIDRNFAQQNGGLLSLIDFENNLYSNRKSYNVNLPTSKSSKKKQEYNVNQQLKILSFQADTLLNNGLYFALNSQYITSIYVFNDSDPLASVYRDIFIDTLATIDSISESNIANRVALKYVKNRFEVVAYGEYDVIAYNQIYGLDTSYNDIYTGFLLMNRGDDFQIDFKGGYAVSGYRKSDINADLSLKYDFDDRFKLTLNSSYHFNEADLRYVNYTSNHFLWKNYDLQKQSILSNQLEVEFTKIAAVLSVENRLISNFIYLNSDVSVVQDNSLHSTSTFKAAKDYQVLNFHFRTALFYQLTSSEVLFPLPQFMGRQLLYYETYLFKKSLKFQIGGNVTFKSGYYGYAYMPAINGFYSQSNTVLGNYPYFDIFINTRLKRAQIFFKYEHFNAGWNGYHYYGTPGYPRLDKSFKFGISWNMFD